MKTGNRDAAASPFALRDEKQAAERKAPHVHILRKGFRCVTDKAGKPVPNGRSNLELVVDASEGFIPLWAQGVILRWQFADGTLERSETRSRRVRRSNASLDRHCWLGGMPHP